MKLKALYDKTGPKPVCNGVQVLNSGTHAEQNFNRRTFVMAGLAEGWLKLSDDEKTLTIRTDEVDLEYEILQPPGYYCRATGERIPLTRMAEEESYTAMQAVLAAAEARKWLEANKQPLYIKLRESSGSPKVVEVANYEALKEFRCRLRADQHEKFRGVRGIDGSLVRVGSPKAVKA